MKKTKLQQGFSAVEILLLLVLVGLVAAIGWYVVSAGNKTKTQLDKTAQESTVAKVTPKTKSSAGDKFIFKELGVEITLPSTLKGLTYTNDSGYLYISDDDYINSLKTCPGYKAEDGPGSFTALGKKTGQYPTDANPIDDGILLKQFPSFYVSYGVPNGAVCGNADKAQAIHDIGGTERGDLIDAFKTATLVQ